MEHKGSFDKGFCLTIPMQFKIIFGETSLRI